LLAATLYALGPTNIPLSQQYMQLHFLDLPLQLVLFIIALDANLLLIFKIRELRQNNSKCRFLFSQILLWPHHYFVNLGLLHLRRRKLVTMAFPGLPSKISRAIFIEAVQVRGVKRAGRLRFVCRSWDAAVMDAMLRSGILVTTMPRRFNAPYWPYYLTYRVLQTSRPLHRGMRIVRQVAERVLASRGQNPSGDTLESYALEICSVCPLLKTFGRNSYHWLQITFAKGDRDLEGEYQRERPGL
jgi:hypothetical protein